MFSLLKSRQRGCNKLVSTPVYIDPFLSDNTMHIMNRNTFDKWQKEMKHKFLEEEWSEGMFKPRLKYEFSWHMERRRDSYEREMKEKIKNSVMRKALDVFERLEDGGMRHGEEWWIEEFDPRHRHRHDEGAPIQMCHLMRWKIRSISDILEYFAEYTRLCFDAEGFHSVHRQGLRDECMMRLMDMKAKKMNLRGYTPTHMHITEFSYIDPQHSMDALRYAIEVFANNIDKDMDKSCKQTKKKKKPLYSPIPNSTMCIADFARKRQLKEQEKILRSANLKDECGDWTDEAVSLFIEELMNRDVAKGKDSFLLGLAKDYLEEKNPKALPAPKKK